MYFFRERVRLARRFLERSDTKACSDSFARSDTLSQSVNLAQSDTFAPKFSLVRQHFA